MPIERSFHHRHPIHLGCNRDLEFAALSTVVTMPADVVDVAMCQLELAAHTDSLVVVPGLPISETHFVYLNYFQLTCKHTGMFFEVHLPPLGYFVHLSSICYRRFGKRHFADSVGMHTI